MSSMFFQESDGGFRSGTWEFWNQGFIENLLFNFSPNSPNSHKSQKSHKHLYKHNHLFYNSFMRIFIGIKLDHAVHDKIEAFLKPFKKISTPIHWVKGANVHLTLKFLGEVAEQQYNQISERLTHLEPQTQPLEIELAGCGKFGKNEELNIFWIGLRPNHALQQLYDSIENTLFKIGIPKETRPFSPHITVGRNKKNYNFKSLLTRVEELADAPIAQFSTGYFQLFKSALKPDGPIYTILKEIPLTHGQA